AFSLDGRRLLTGSRDVARVWNLETSEVLAELRHRKPASLTKNLIGPHPIFAVAFSSNNELLLTGSSDNSVCLWDARTCESMRTLQHPDKVKSVAIDTKDEFILTTCEDRKVRLWRVADGKELGCPMSHPDRISAAVFSSDAKL